MEKYIPLSIPNFEGNEKKYVDDALQLGWVSTGGAYITKLEEMMAEYLHIPQVVACQSGTSALHLALLGCGVEPGDMVIVPTLTFKMCIRDRGKTEDTNVFICVGPPLLRKKIADRLMQNPNLHFPNLILSNMRICEDVQMGKGCMISMDAVSYTHLDVYKRQTRI